VALASRREEVVNVMVVSHVEAGHCPQEIENDEGEGSPQAWKSYYGPPLFTSASLDPLGGAAFYITYTDCNNFPSGYWWMENVPYLTILAVFVVPMIVWCCCKCFPGRKPPCCKPPHHGPRAANLNDALIPVNGSSTVDPLRVSSSSGGRCCSTPE
jgi:hypothetical protein